MKKEKEKIQALIKEVLYNQIQTVLKSAVDKRKEQLQEVKKVELEKAQQPEIQQRIKEAEQDLDTIFSW